MKILVAVDGSDHSQRALAYVLEHIAMFGSTPEITLLNVHREMPSARVKAMVGQEVINQYYQAEAEQAFVAARASIAQHKRSAGEVLKIGEPGHEIASLANTGFDLLVMGTHGRSEIRNLVMGSAATRALAESTVPVLLVK